MAGAAATGDQVTLLAVGDVGPIRDDPGSLFQRNRHLLRDADIAFCQLERVLSEREDAALVSPLVNNPRAVAAALADAGFDVISTAGNHHMDAGLGPFVDTLNVLKDHGIQPVGVGMNIGEARTPAIVERNGTRVAFLGYSAVIPRSGSPTEATATRPGCAPMFISTFYEQIDWQPGTPPKIVTFAHKEDLEAMREDVKRAKAIADIVVMSIHWGVHMIPAVLADYQFEVGHAAIDAGVDLILGHHAHILKGIEVYKGKVIFHCLGNFAIDRPRKTKAKGAVHGRGRTPSYWSDEIEPGWEAFPYPADMRKTMIAKCLIVDKQVRRVSFLPCAIGRDAQAEPLAGPDPRSDEVYEYVKWCSADQKLGTRFAREGDEIVVLTSPLEGEDSAALETATVGGTSH
jgi:poly-gamma-glutamate synthesis protein (capsule biosynthesis protein)